MSRRPPPLSIPAVEELQTPDFLRSGFSPSNKAQPKDSTTNNNPRVFFRQNSNPFMNKSVETHGIEGKNPKGFSKIGHLPDYPPPVIKGLKKALLQTKKGGKKRVESRKNKNKITRKKRR